MFTRPAPKPVPRPKKAKRPVPRVNPVRAKKREERDFGEKGKWIRTLPCCLTGKRTGDWIIDPELGKTLVVIVAAHFPSRGAGGHAEHLVPLADHLHRWAHVHSDKALAQRFEVNLKQLTRVYEARFQLSQRSLP